ncbi:hypothetical protein B0O99DRAFT_374214 [Bisporella sp. PMI_857]|nr:hypothetical protein B0O99DRAFT_374214 [Bisporella sp. PMI_857]
MLFFNSLPQVSLLAAILASTTGTYIALSPPNPNPSSRPVTGDSLRRLSVTNKLTIKVALATLGFLALHTCGLVYLYPNIPGSVLRHGALNDLNIGLITWSTSTAIPLALILCVGAPFRLVSYTALGKDFTFALAKPDRLRTSGIYRYVQHPSYTGLIVLILCNVALLFRMDGVLGCWIPPQLYQDLRSLEWALDLAGLLVLMVGVWTRVKEEERMLQAEFNVKWEKWHAVTARFIPWVF